jgi:hypothetical protein
VLVSTEISTNATERTIMGVTSSAGEKVQLWLWNFPEHDDLALLAIKQTGEEEDATYELRDVWFHELSCPCDRLDAKDLFSRWRNRIDSEEIAGMIAAGDLQPIDGLELPHWTPRTF